MQRLIRSRETLAVVSACLFVMMGNDLPSANCDELEAAKVSLADIEQFVGDWVFVSKEHDNLAATLKASWILDKHFLEVDAQGVQFCFAYLNRVD